MVTELAADNSDNGVLFQEKTIGHSVIELALLEVSTELPGSYAFHRVRFQV